MAAVDTILVLDGLQFEQVNTADIYTQDHATNEAVKTFGFHIPLSAKAARVIFNGAYDPDGGRFHVRAKGTRVTSITTPTKTANQELLAWTVLTPPAVLESAAFDVSASWDSMIHVDVAQSSVSANTTGLELIVQIRKEDSLDEWTELQGGRRNVMALGAATKSDVVATEQIGETTIAVTKPTAGNLDHLGKFAFLEDTATPAESEIIFVVECGLDA